MTGKKPEEINTKGGAFIGGDVTVNHGGMFVGRDLIVIQERALNAAEEAEQRRDFEFKHLAEGVNAYAERLQKLARNGEAGGEPYKGLLEYRLADTAIFFGRDKSISDVLKRIQRGPLTILQSESGAGKTSLLQAGISSRLIRAQHLPVYLRPYDLSPTLAVKKALLPDLSSAPELAHTSLRSFLYRVCNLLGTETALCIFIDQFEEFFVRLDEIERSPFVDELAACLEDPGLNVKWVLSLREEYYGKLFAFEARLHNHLDNQYHLERLSRLEAVEVITRPAGLKGISFEAGLVDTILDDLGANTIAPPQVQLVCSALYDDRRQDSAVITSESYQAEGRAEAILRGYLERVLNRNVPVERRSTAHLVLEAMVTSDAQRAIRSYRELLAEAQLYGTDRETLDAVLSQLTNSRLLRTHESSAGSEVAYELVHDYLLNEIKLTPDVQARKAAQELLDQEVRAHERLKESLISEERLKVIVDHRSQLILTPAATQLIDASDAAIRQSKRKRQRLFGSFMIGVVVVALLMALLGLFGLNKSDESQRQAATAQAANARSVSEANNRATAEAAAVAQRDEAQRQANVALSRKLAVQSTSHLDNRFDLALLLSIESSLVADSVEARNSLLTGLERHPGLTTMLHDHGAVFSVAFSPDGKTLASGGCGMYDSLNCTQGEIILWDVSNPKMPVQLSLSLGGHANAVNSVVFSPDGKILASGSDDETIILWDVSNRQLPSQLGVPLKGDSGTVYDIVFSPDGKTLAAGNTYGTILWDVSNRRSPVQLGAPLTGHGNMIRSVTFSPDGKTLAAGCQDKTIVLWDVSDRQSPIQLGAPLTGHADYVSSVVFSPDGKTLASGSCGNDVCTQGEITLWDVSNRQLPVQLGKPLSGHGGEVRSMAFSPDGKTLASSGWDIFLWDVSNRQSPAQSGAPLSGHGSTVSSVAFSPDGKTLASGSRDTTIILWNVSNWQSPALLDLQIIGYGDAVRSVAFSPDNNTLASGSCGMPNGLECTQGGIVLWDVSNRRPPVQLATMLTGHTDRVNSVTFSPDGKTLASGSWDKTIILWDISNRQRPVQIGKPLSGHDAAVQSIAFSPDGKTLASGSADKTVILWDVSNRQRPVQIGRPLSGHDAEVRSVVFSPDGKTLASGGADNAIILWEISDRQKPIQMVKPLSGHGAIVHTAAFSPDGRTLASGSGDTTIILWDISNRQLPAQLGKPLSGHGADVMSVAFSPDGMMLASGSMDATIILWDISNQLSPIQLGGLLNGHGAGVRSVAFSPDGKTLASGSDDSTIILWDVDLKSWRERACEKAGRNLNHVEWIQHLGNRPYSKTCPQWPDG